VDAAPVSAGGGQLVSMSARAARCDLTIHTPIASNTASTSQRPRRPRCPSTFSAIDLTLPPDAHEG
jgi:hypothetical protein